MKRPLAYITAAWLGGDSENAELAAQYCRTVYEAGFSPICPPLYLPLFLNDAVPEEHKSGIDMSRDLLRRSHVLVVCGHSMTEAMKNDIAVAQRLGITATTLEGMYHTSDRRRTMARMLAALPDMDTEMRRLVNGTIAKLERMTDADFDGQRFDFTGE